MHTHGFFRALAKPLWLHLRDSVGSAEYRALHRFKRQIGSGTRPAGKPLTVHFQGRPICLGDGPSFLSAWDEIFVNGIYDIGSNARPPRMIDGGANVGLAALYWKRRYGAFSYVGFEPDAAVAEICRRNLRAWDVEGELHQCALGSTDGAVAFVGDGADGGHVVDLPGGQSAEVRSVRLSPFLNEPVDLLKLDIEGSELSVLRECEGCLERVRNVFVEVHSRPGEQQALPEVLAILHRASFRVEVHAGFGAIRPFAEPRVSPAGFDSLANVFARRDRR